MLSDYLLYRAMNNVSGGGEAQNLPFNIFSAARNTEIECEIFGVKLFKVSDSFPKDNLEGGCFVWFTLNAAKAFSLHPQTYEDGNVNATPGTLQSQGDFIAILDPDTEEPLVVYVSDAIYAEFGFPEAGCYVANVLALAYWAILWANPETAE